MRPRILALKRLMQTPFKWMDEWIKGCFKMQLLLLSIRPTDQESAPFKQDFVTLRDPKGRGHATPRGHVGKRGGGGGQEAQG